MAASKDRMTRATLKLWRELGSAFRDWAKEVGAAGVTQEATQKFNEGIEIVMKGAKSYKGRAEKIAKRVKKRAGVKAASGKKTPTKKKAAKKKRKAAKKAPAKKK